MAADPRYGWNPSAGRYVNGRGQFVPEEQVRAALRTALNFHGSVGRDLLLRLRARTISTSEFSLGMRQMIRDTQLYSAALAVGGREQMTPQLLGLVGQRIRQQNDFLANFVEQIRLGLPLDGRAVARAELYALSAWGTWSEFNQRMHLGRGVTEYRNRLRPADHCDECVQLTALQWQPVGTLKPVGQRQCMTRCRCFFEYR